MPPSPHSRWPLSQSWHCPTRVLQRHGHTKLYTWRIKERLSRLQRSSKKLEGSTAPAKRRNVKSDAADGHERAKDYLDPHEIDRLLEAAKEGRHGPRDHTLLLLIYRHALQVSEAITIRISALNLKQARLAVNRSKNSLSTEQPLAGDELRAVRRYLATREDKLPWLFLSERGQPMTRQAVNHLIQKPASARVSGGCGPHMLRHSCGFCFGEQGRRLQGDTGLLGTPRPPPHGSLHAHERAGGSRGCGISHVLPATLSPPGAFGGPPGGAQAKTRVVFVRAT